MPETTSAFYIVTVAGGKCLENTQGRGVLNCRPKDDDKQKWVFEQTGDDPNIVAIKNCADGQYLRNTQPHAVSGARIAMGTEKQDWTIEKGGFPRSCALKSNACTVGKSYLNDYNGGYEDNHYVHMWQWVPQLDWWLTWYLVDATTSASFNPVQAQAGGKANTGEVEKREKALAEKEKKAADRLKDLEKREASLRDGEAKSKGAVGVAASKKPQSTGDDSDKKRQELAEKEASLKERERKVANQEAALKQSQGSGADNDKKNMGLERRETDLKERERKIAEQEAALKKAQKAMDVVRIKTNNGEDQDTKNIDLLKAQIENLNLKLQIKDLESELEKARQQSQMSAPPTGQAPQTPKPAAPIAAKGKISPNGTSSKPANGTARAPTASANSANSSKPLSKKEGKDQATRLRDAAKDSDAIVYSCGHVVYPPPRKVDKKVVGILYEGESRPHAFSARQKEALAKAGL